MTKLKNINKGIEIPIVNISSKIKHESDNASYEYNHKLECHKTRRSIQLVLVHKDITTLGAECILNPYKYGKKKILDLFVEKAGPSFERAFYEGINNEQIVRLFVLGKLILN